MADRGRSLAAALSLTPEAQQFIRGAKQTTVEEPPEKLVTAAPESSEREGNSKELEHRQRPIKRRIRKAPADPAKPKVSSRARVAITTRFTQDTADALRRESLERKLRNEDSWSQQEIVEVAVKAYLSGGKKTSRQDG